MLPRRAHLRALHAAGRTAMIQPYLSGVDVAGRARCCISAAGSVTACGRRRSWQRAASRSRSRSATTTPASRSAAREASAAELAVAERVLAAVPGGADLLYARVDLLPGPDGQPVLLELELTEPSLFLWTAPGSADRLADAVVRAAGRDSGRRMRDPAGAVDVEDAR